MSVQAEKEQRKKGKNKAVKATGRHKMLYAILRAILAPFFCLRLNYKPEKVRVKHTPTVVLINHNSNYDPILAGIAFKSFMYFVASEHVLRWGFLSKIISCVFDPIIRVKGTTEARAAMDILKTLRRGNNVCIFAEGNRSFNGETGLILPSTGKLIKKSGAALVTYTLRGNYLSTPRWGENIRRGVIEGSVVREYSPAQIAEMSDDEVNAAIIKDLFVNAYDDQKKKNVQYRANKKRLAVGIEIALYLCPSCGRYGTIRSEEDRFYCDCGLRMRYTDYGWLQSADGETVRFDNITDWDHWQREELEKKLSENGDTGIPIFWDADQRLLEIEGRTNVREIQTGRLTLYRDRLEIGEKQEKKVFPLRELDDLEINSRMNITFLTREGKKYEIRSEIFRSPVKYREAYRILMSPEGLERLLGSR